MKLSLLALVLTSALACAAPEIGQPAPAFTLTSAAGKPVSLSDYKGKFVVLEWTNYQCPFVRNHYNGGHMQALQQEFTGKGVVWLSIISSAPGREGYFDPAQLPAAVQKEGVKSTAVLSDASGQVAREYGAKSTPDMFIINPAGVLIYSGAIDDTPSTNPGDLATAKNYVVAALGEAMAGKPVTVSLTKSYGCSIKY